MHKSDVVEHQPIEISKLHLRKVEKELMVQELYTTVVFKRSSVRKHGHGPAKGSFW